MSVYFVTGRLGGGKTLAAVDKIREYLTAGRRVATNLDLNLEHLMPSGSRAVVTRVPDKPRIEDLVALGKGCDDGKHTESKFGLLVLDECLTWLNSRTWNDKSRLAVLDWFLHARKMRWDIIFIMQNVDACDAQLRDSLCEHFVQCRRLDRLRLFKVIKLPRIHHANVYYGTNSTTGMYVERWVYRGTDLFEAYDTEQVFHDGVEFLASGATDMRASYTQLSAWHLKGRYEKPDEVKRRSFPLTWKLVFLPVLLAWSAFDDNWFKVAFRERHLAKARERLCAERDRRRELLRQALDPAVYPPICSVLSDGGIEHGIARQGMDAPGQRVVDQAA